ncbi:hypothetical protein Ga0123461_1755 [Mariprofundus aestuarium]|uniref:Uncharacterized protein n=1 Tax=Mariprofundus aestuarium TaxID=1921086 RepID=A0A2K8KYV3_MARES|nr:hypothetical protein [Mariprofundus aestuarium]ATX80168.1 hypothetical protein Ga0123461_1755 [Mariprofundus aestuarium]
MAKRRSTRINTMFSENTFDWLKAEADERGQSLAQVVRDKVSLAKRESASLEQLTRLEKIIKKSHSLIIDKLAGNDDVE